MLGFSISGQKCGVFGYTDIRHSNTVFSRFFRGTFITTSRNSRWQAELRLNAGRNAFYQEYAIGNNVWTIGSFYSFCHLQESKIPLFHKYLLYLAKAYHHTAKTEELTRIYSRYKCMTTRPNIKQEAR